MTLRVLFAFLLSSTAVLAQARASEGPSGGSSISPCADFYQYTCGAWTAANPIPRDEAAWGVTSELQERNTATLREILDAARPAAGDRSVLQREIGDFYESCMATDEIERWGTRGLADDLARIEHADSKQLLLEIIVMLHRKGINPFWIVSAEPDPDHSTIKLAHISQSGFSLPGRAYYVRQDQRSVELRKKLQQHIETMLKLLGDDPATAASEAGEIVHLETQMAQAALDRQDQIDPTKSTHRLSFDQLKALMPHFDWAAYSDTMHMPAIQEVNVRSPEYLRGIDHLLDTTSLSVLKRYLRWRLLTRSTAQLPHRFDAQNFRFYGTVLNGIEEQKPRWWRCTNKTDNELGEALGQEFVARKFPPAARQRIADLVHELEISLREDIQELPWMSQGTRAQALRKLNQLNRKFGYPDHWIDYSSVPLRRDDYLGNVQRVDAYLIARDLAKIGKAVDPTEWDLTPPTVNAYYEPPTNSINFPAGILQPPLFSATATDAENLGAIGIVIGHELTHGFDNNGRRFDADGNLRDWWKPEDNKAFEDRAQCVIDEYNSFDFAPGVKGNGRLTLGENIADNAGIRIAFRALQRLEAKNPGAAEQRDARGLTPEQQFFMAFGGSWCQNMRDETAGNLALIDEHSPARWRVNGTVQNMPEFQKAFGCTSGQAMVRTPACRVW